MLVVEAGGIGTWSACTVDDGVMGSNAAWRCCGAQQPDRHEKNAAIQSPATTEVRWW